MFSTNAAIRFFFLFPGIYLRWMRNAYIVLRTRCTKRRKHYKEKRVWRLMIILFYNTIHASTERERGNALKVFKFTIFYFYFFLFRVTARKTDNYCLLCSSNELMITVYDNNTPPPYAPSYEIPRRRKILRRNDVARALSSSSRCVWTAGFGWFNRYFSFLTVPRVRQNGRHR